MKVYYFTGTGNSRYIAERICAAAGGGEALSIAEALRGQGGAGTSDIVLSGDAVGLVFPVYWLCVPAPAIQFLRRVRIESSYIFAVLNYGGIALTAHDHLLEIARERGIRLSLLAGCRMPDNFAPWYDLERMNRRFTADKIQAKADRVASRVAARRKGGTHATITRPFLYYSKKRAAREALDFDKRIFRVEAHCTGCGLCAQACPAGNIRFGTEGGTGPRPVFGGACWCCLACTNTCPVNAIRCKGEKNKARYYNPFVTPIEN
ncbi:MAG: EFR1 family ferrodoxin [Clostridiales Family XIII bacterium]|jgi:ferredoxin|nr:EFR1 family ferrodoxin [Clostridiales Family XIII bacterium]